MRPIRYSLFGVALVSAFLLTSMPAHAQNSAACLLMGRAERVQTQPLKEFIVYMQIQGVRSNNTLAHANDVECSKVFKTGSGLWVSLNAASVKSSSIPDPGEQLWLSLRYIENNGLVLRKYELISREIYLEKKDGIQ